MVGGLSVSGIQVIRQQAAAGKHKADANNAAHEDDRYKPALYGPAKLRLHEQVRRTGSHAHSPHEAKQ